MSLLSFKKALRPLPILLILFSVFIIPNLPSNLAPILDTTTSRLGLSMIPFILALTSKHPVVDVIVSFVTIALLFDWSHEKIISMKLNNKTHHKYPKELKVRTNSVIQDLSYDVTKLSKNVVKPIANRMEREIALPFHQLAGV